MLYGSTVHPEKAPKMTQPRKQQTSMKDTPYYHCIAPRVCRHWLLVGMWYSLFSPE